MSFTATETQTSVGYILNGWNEGKLEIDDNTTFQKLKDDIATQEDKKAADVTGHSVIIRISDLTQTVKGLTWKTIETFDVEKEDADKTWWDIAAAFVSGLFGWSKPGTELGTAWYTYMFYVLTFLDTTVDAIIAWNAIFAAPDLTATNPGDKKALGVVVFFATMAGTVVGGCHEVVAERVNPKYHVGYWVLMKLTTFMVQDGASIIYLAAFPEDGPWNFVSAILSITIGVVFVVWGLWKLITDSPNWSFRIIGIVLLCFPVYMLCILLFEVLINTKTDLQGTLMLTTLIVWGVGSIGMLLFFGLFHTPKATATTTTTGTKKKIE